MLAALLCTLLAAGEPAPLAERLRLEALAAVERQTQGEAGYRFRIVGQSPLPPAAGDQARLEFSHLSKREPTGRFFAAFRVLQDGRLLGTTRVDLEGQWNGSVLTAKTGLARKAVPEASELEATPMEGNPPPGALTTWPEGFRLRQPVAAGKVLTHADLEPIPLVNQGDRVRLTLTAGNLSIASEAIARTQGAKGDRIRVELPSRKVLQALVTGEGEARIAWQSAAR